MLLRVVVVVFACLYSSQGWNADLSGRFPGQPEQQIRPGLLNSPRCFGLARKTRPQKVNVPLIYNSRTGQSLPFPKYLYTADHSVIAMVENDGWEVRMKNAFIPRVLYDRVPICCPWEQNCDSGKQVITSPAADNSGSCANGGQMIYRDGQQRCECAPGYQGIWCHLRVLPGENQPHASFPSGPLIRMLPRPAPYGDMVRDADMWRSKAKQFPGSPMLKAKDHFTAAASPWAYRAAAMMQHQIMQAKMAQMEQMYRQTHGDFNKQMPQQPIAPGDVRRNTKVLAGNPYNIIDSRANSKFLPVSEANKNPYSTISSQGQLPPNMVRAFYAAQGELKQKQALNPYSHMSQEVPLPMAHMQRMNGDHAVNLYNNQPAQGRDIPQARTPWDLDPFGQQQNPSYMNYPGMPLPPNRRNQAMAFVLYQQLLNQQKSKLSGRNDSLNQPIVNSVGVQTSAVVPPVSIETQQQQQPLDATQQQQQPLDTTQQQQQPLDATQQQQQQPLDATQKESNQSQQVTNVPETTSSNMNEQQQNPMNGQPLTPMLGPSAVHQQQPNSEEMKRIEQCQAILTPRLSDCLIDYGLVMEQFMNPEYMQKARAVCLASQAVGQCIMQHDKACGEGDAIMTTRKMINSVLHMMGMICQQIAARGEAPIMPAQDQQNFLQAPGTGMPVLVPEPIPPNEVVYSDRTLPPADKLQEPPTVNENSQQQGQAQPSGQSNKSSHLNSVHYGRDITEVPVNKGLVGHDSAHPVSQELKVLGYPLWLVITVGLALFVALILFVVVICLCCRRRRRQKSLEANKEIEKMPAHLERVCSIGIPPPSYNTTVLQQNEDGLDLPPLGLNDNSVTDDADIKIPLDDEADDKSDEADDKKRGEKGL